MASGSEKTYDDDYNSALQRLMKECLPPILVEIVDRRPSDPIQYMAHSLHKYREKEDIGLFHLEPSEDHGENCLNPMQLDSNYSNKPQVETVGQQFSVQGMIVERDFSCVSEHFEAFHISNTLVHQHSLNVLKMIGDIFDEDDIS